MTEMTQTTGEHLASPSHQGILREEVLALRQLLGYTDHVETSPSLVVPDLGARVPCLQGTQTKDILLVAIDVDVPQFYHKDNANQIIHIGVSILDTRRIQMLADSAEGPAVSPDKIIDNYQFVLGGLRKPELAKKVSAKFLFGESEFIDRAQVQTRLEELIVGRNFATVFHGTKLDLDVLNDLGVDFPSRGVYIFDTNKVAQWPLQLHYRLNLEKLCAALDIPFTLGHTAGNDAHFTLRALLMLAVKDVARLRQMHKCNTSEILLHRIRQIALAPRPTLESDQSGALLGQKDAKRQEAETLLVRKLEKKARKQARKQLRRETGTDTNGTSAPDEESIQSAVFAEKYQELSRFQQLPQATKKEIRKQQREARMARQQEEQAAREQAAGEATDSDEPSISDSSRM